jgi:hypothetical protein
MERLSRTKGKGRVDWILELEHQPSLALGTPRFSDHLRGLESTFPASLCLQFADSRSWDFSDFIIMCTNTF